MADLSDLRCDITDAGRSRSHDDHSTASRLRGSHIGCSIPDHQDSIHRTTGSLRACDKHPWVRFGPESAVVADHTVEVAPPTELDQLFRRRLTAVIGGQSDPKPMILQRREKSSHAWKRLDCVADVDGHKLLQPQCRLGHRSVKFGCDPSGDLCVAFGDHRRVRRKGPLREINADRRSDPLPVVAIINQVLEGANHRRTPGSVNVDQGSILVEHNRINIFEQHDRTVGRRFRDHADNHNRRLPKAF